MNVSGYSKSHSYMVDLLLQQKAAMEDKSIQVTTGKKAQTYGGMESSDARMALDMRREISEIEVYENSNTIAGMQLEVMGSTLEYMEQMRVESVAAIDENSYTLTTNGQTTSQQATEIMLKETMAQLNTEVNGYYLYGGADASQPPVVDYDVMMDGQDGQMGLKELMKRYEDAHMGASGNGRLDNTLTSPGGVPTITLQQDNVEGFGFQISSVSSSSSAVTTTVIPEDLSDPSNPVGQQATFEFNSVPEVGDTIEVEVELPDGSKSTVKLTATDDPDAGPGTFLIGTGADPLTETAENAQAALQEELNFLAQTDLRAAADTQAGEEFFGNHGRDDPTPKVPKADGSGYEDDSVEVVQWYTGTDNDEDPRQDKVVQIDDNVTIAYGARANEPAFSEQLQNMAVFVAADFEPETPGDEESEAIAKAYYSTLAHDTDQALSTSADQSSGVQTVATEIAATNTQLSRTEERLNQTKLSYENMLGEAENVDTTVAAAELAILDTNLEASYAATSKMLNLSIVNYL